MKKVIKDDKIYYVKINKYSDDRNSYECILYKKIKIFFISFYLEIYREIYLSIYDFQDVVSWTIVHHEEKENIKNMFVNWNGILE